ncbi:MAG: GMP synthase [Candidatus Bathyarchaeota archaeon]|nr:GMP synthase [Candidatus Bathyarchaeota archaeon]
MKQVLGNERALIAVSGGVDSTTSAVLTHRAIGNNLLCVIIDDAFMRIGEIEKVVQTLSQPPLNLPMRVLNVQERFLAEMKGLRDAEEKRKKFRETFYKVLSETAKKEKCKFLVQGTIQADIVETRGGVKTQHNVLEQIGISTKEVYGFQVVEPVVSLYKGEVRKVARYLGVPDEMSERQPFPGPALSVRVVGEIRRDKLVTLKKATHVAEKLFSKHMPSQYFAAIIDDQAKQDEHLVVHIQNSATRLLNVPKSSLEIKIFADKATGVKAGQRRYGEIVAVTALTQEGAVYQVPINDLVVLQKKIITEHPEITRVLYTIKQTGKQQSYVVSLRAIQTNDFLTAEVSDIPWTTLNQAAKQILNTCSNVSCVCYDVTPKPPATIEME